MQEKTIKRSKTLPSRHVQRWRPVKSVPAKEGKSFLQDNMFKVAWNGILLVGGLFALLFFGHIEFLPEIGLANATTFLASIALVGLFFCGVFAASFMVPGWALYFSATELHAQPSWLQLFISAISALGVLASIALKLPNMLPSLLTGAMIVLVVGAFILVFTGEASKTTVSSHGAPTPKQSSRATWKWIERVSCWVFTCFSYCKSISAKPTTRFIFSLAALSSLWIVACTIATLAFASMYKGEDDTKGLLTLLTWWAWIITSGIIVWNPSSKKPVPASFIAITAGASLLILVVLCSNPAAIPSAAARALGMGNIERVQLIVSEQGCVILQGIAGNTVCKTEKDIKAFVVKPVVLKSRLGAQYLIEVCSNGQAIDIAMKKDDVLAWSRAMPPAKEAKKSSVPATLASPSVAPASASTPKTSTLAPKPDCMPTEGIAIRR